jgi:DNA-binding GntR family transcriptional regulator
MWQICYCMSRVIPRLTQGPSLADQAYRVLRQMLTDGDLEPGERLTERDLATRLGVSPTPVREAIRRLEHERLLERNDGRALTVAQPSLRRLAELREIEAALRGVAAKLATVAASDAELEEIRTTFEASARLSSKARPRAADVAEILRLTGRMHALIDDASHNALLVQMIATAKAFDWQTRLRAAERLGASYPVHEPQQHHRAIVEALVARDGERAEALMVAHIREAGQRLLDVVSAERHEAQAQAT